MSHPFAEKMQVLEREYEDLGERLGRPEVYSNPEELKRLSKQRAQLEKPVLTFRALRSALDRIAQAQQMLHDEHDQDLREMARAEVEELDAQRARLEEELTLALLTPDPNEGKNVIIEIRPAAGGEEAALFAADLFRMYSRFAEQQGWPVEILVRTPSSGGMGGFKEVVFSMASPEAYRLFKHESGPHRVQRVPVTEASGRLHTSTATVAVLPEAEEIEVELDPRDLEWETFRASGAGGQHVQKNETAVRVRHVPSDIVVSFQDERSQLQNRQKALRVLRAHLLERMQREQGAEIAASRRAQIGTGDRSERIRTYNFPQDRVTDHRIGKSWHGIQTIMDGDLRPILEALAEAERAKQLETLGRHTG
jgi:peptide chain release factor 1